MTHTPGPWTTEQPSGLTNPEPNWLPIYAPKWWHLAKVVVELDGERSEEGEANARLIAAAPELLEACKAIADHYDEDEILSGDLNKLRAAIAKAEGKQ
jgi:hypothetical protein